MSCCTFQPFLAAKRPLAVVLERGRKGSQFILYALASEPDSISYHKAKEPILPTSFSQVAVYFAGHCCRLAVCVFLSPYFSTGTNMRVGTDVSPTDLQSLFLIFHVAEQSF